MRGDGVRLRAEASAMADLVPFDLMDGDVLEVLSSENRDLLYVSVARQEGVEGLVSRKYMKQLVK